ncbi:NADP-dependent oxidoreductase [Saccharibacillus sp. CPCC 101409]|uniref:NADP-dependent oxidoreductase n=1 Tax=Saccharibacillus sp. CPCC 101409 TaxID=3058041 RepID=UPI0026710459|nr:NADP-dependent oxidoreductase [Saccharibacillus sp. CPCC 101409]MDO3410439.1 NADP-dependent oxidoreductase [Saccharibacillus sp. CPCC 101409]
MKAIVIEEFGGPDKLHEQSVPEPKIDANQILIKLYATSVNPVDTKIREGAMGAAAGNFPLILGGDVAGIVKEVGDNVSRFKLRDPVFARPRKFGTYAQYVAVDADVAAIKPDNISYEEAAAVPLAGLTAWQALVDHGKVKAGDKVLIHAGAGGVGSMAIQIAKHLGAEVASTAGSENEQLVKSLGADTFIDYKKEDFSEILSDYDMVLDTMGGDVQHKSFQVLKPGGHLVSLLEKPDENLAKDLGVHTAHFMMEPKGDQLEKLADLIKHGKLKPVIDSTYWLNEQGVRDAHEKSESHHVKGKIVLREK